MHHSEVNRGCTDRDLLLVSSEASQRPLAVLMRQFSSIVPQHYGEIVATAHTAEVIRDWLPVVYVLGPGPDFAAVEAVQYCRFLEPMIEQHRRCKARLAAALLQLDACWLPTPMAARTYLQALRDMHKSHREFGDFNDNASALAVADHHIRTGEPEAGLHMLYRLYAHIMHSKERQSTKWLLPEIRSRFLRHGASMNVVETLQGPRRRTSRTALGRGHVERGHARCTRGRSRDSHMENDRVRIEWEEDRQGVCWRVIAEREASGWTFSDQEPGEIRWYPLPPRVDLITQAETLVGMAKSVEPALRDVAVALPSVIRATVRCATATVRVAGEVLISPDVFPKVWEHVGTDPTPLVTQHAGDRKAYRVKRGEGSMPGDHAATRRIGDRTRCTRGSFPECICCQQVPPRQAYASEGRQDADMHLVHASAEDQAEDQEDLAIVFGALTELARLGILTAALDALYVNTLGTPLGQTLAHHLPHTKAAWARPKSFVSQAEHLRILAQKLSVHIMQDYQGSPASQSGSCVERGSAADTRHTPEDSEAR